MQYNMLTIIYNPEPIYNDRELTTNYGRTHLGVSVISSFASEL
jgi:hypothetical protein